MIDMLEYYGHRRRLLEDKISLKLKRPKCII